MGEFRFKQNDPGDGLCRLKTAVTLSKIERAAVTSQIATATRNASQQSDPTGDIENLEVKPH